MTVRMESTYIVQRQLVKLCKSAVSGSIGQPYHFTPQIFMALSTRVFSPCHFMPLGGSSMQFCTASIRLVHPISVARTCLVPYSDVASNLFFVGPVDSSRVFWPKAFLSQRRLSSVWKGSGEIAKRDFVRAGIMYYIK